jgi:DNA-directed RNA polymerase specialized sigma24 family protein
MSTSGGNDEAVRSTHSVTNAWEQWKAGDVDAQYDLTVLLRGLMIELLRYVQSNRGAKFQAVIDSHAVLNDALCRLLTKAHAGGFADIRNRSDLRGKLYIVVKYVLRDEKRRYSTRGRSDGAEVHDMELLKDLASRSVPDPGEGLLEELREKLRGVHKDAMNILERRLEGLTPAEIAAELGMGVRNVQRIIRLMKDAVDGPF